MRLAKRDIKVERSVMPRDEAVRFFRDMGEEYKAKIIEDIPQGEQISLYRQGNFIDLCRGPHVPGTGKLKAFKLMKVAGAYWRGDSRNEMLARIYGTAWTSKETARRLPAPDRGGRKARSPQDRHVRSISSTCRRRRRAWCSGTSAAGASTRSSRPT